MRDAYGGIVNITFVVAFLVIVSGYLAFSVNYNKAFRAKNTIINAIEVCEGITEDLNDCANTQIQSYMRETGYSVPSGFSISNFHCPSNKGYCWKENDVTIGDSSEVGNKKYYTVVTAVNIDLPIINRILPNVKLFQVSGNTKTITQHS